MAEDRGWTVIYVLTVTGVLSKEINCQFPFIKLTKSNPGSIIYRENHKWCQSIITHHWYRTAGGNCASSIFLFSVTARDYNKSEISIIQRLSWINNGGRVYLFSGYPRDINNKAIIIRQQHKKLSLLINIPVYPSKVHRCRKSKIIYFKQ